MSPWLLIPLAILVAWLWITSRAIGRIRGQIDDAESRLARRFYTLQGRVTEIDATVRNLDFERRRQRGEIRFAPDCRVADAVAIHPRVREILAAFGLSGSGCGPGEIDESRTLAEVCRDASLDVREVMRALARFVEDPEKPLEIRPASARLYRIRELRR